VKTEIDARSGPADGPATGREGLAVLAPADGSLVGTIDVTSPDEIPGHVATARSGFASWSRVPIGARAAMLEAAADALAPRAEEIGRLMARESGKILSQSIFEVRGSIGLLRGNGERARALEGRLIPTSAWPGNERDVAWEERIPLGVVAAIIPFNFPVELAVEKAAAALVMGNAVILKPPGEDPLAILEVVAALHAAGVPRDVLLVAAGPGVGAALASAEGIDAVSLTGSTRAGISVARSGAAYLRRLHLELGGNDALIVLDDADLDLALSEAVRGRLMMNGQTCASNKRIILHRAIAERFRDALVSRVATVRVGDPLDPASEMGPLIDAEAAATVAGQARRAIEEGARLVLGDLTPRGAFLDPHVLADVPPSAGVARDDEVFGPVFTLVTVDDDEQAVRVANASMYGLMGSVFSADVARALAVADRLETGGVVVNGTGNYRPPFIPFGGVKMSGYGREGLGYTLEEMSQLRFTVIRRLRR
jgi:acyl-CoA reductase-like NAD-dependent aldehyde dehydrogenase